jgi:hypothetical protein
MPPPPWEMDAYRAQGKVEGFFGDGLFALVQPGSESLTVLDAERGRGWYWVRSSESLGTFERAAPLRTLLHLWLTGRGVGVVHAGAVGTPEGCLLLAGPTAAGKSTTALSAPRSGLRVLADDSCLLRFEPEPVAHSLYSSAKATDATLAHLPVLAPRVANPDREPWEKALLFLDEWTPEWLLAAAPVRGVVLPRVTGEPETRVAPISPMAALAALAPSTLLQMPGSGETELRRLGELVRTVSCHRLEAGSDPDGVASALADLLERA